ncbi:hypothetical protein ABT127_06900 [Streptomyces sp. NPDC001904]|uniref:hypothetical protein n=1 Tax=Streptomyces sp. NPDC001904 TaxID=3154531 RepID=UPI003324AF70
MFVLLMYGALLAVPVWAVAVLIKLVSVVLPGRRPDWARDLMLWCAAMAAAAALLVYVVGLGAVQWDAHEAESGAGSAPAEPCRSLAPAASAHLTGHEPSYLPLGFRCLLDDGSEIAGAGPYTWLNTLTVAFALAAVVLALAVGFRDEFRARAERGTDGAARPATPGRPPGAD